MSLRSSNSGKLRFKGFSEIIPVGSMAIILLAGPSARGASATWSATPTNGNWEAAAGETNWSTGAATFPGALSSVTNTDVATFGASSTTTVSINSTVDNASPLGVGSITFAAIASPPAFTVGSVSGNSLWLRSGGTVSIASGSTVAGATEAINSPIVLQPATATSAITYTFSNASALAGSILKFGGTVTTGTTSAAATLTLTGASTTANEVSGTISDGGATGGLSISKTSSGSWTLSGDNTFTGNTLINVGTLNVSSIADTGTSALGLGTQLSLGSAAGSSGTLIYNSTGITPATTSRALVLAATSTGAGIFGNNSTSSSATISFTGTITNLGTDKVIQLQGTNSGANTIQGDISNGPDLGDKISIIKAEAGSWTLTGANTYTGDTWIKQGTLAVSSIADTGTSALGLGTLLKLGSGTVTPGTLTYQSSGNTPATTSRSVELNAANSGGSTIRNNSADPAASLTFTGTCTNLATGAVAKTFTFSGSNTGANEFQGTLANGVSALNLSKAGDGTWSLTGASTYTGTTVVSGGTLSLARAAATATMGQITVSNTAATNATLKITSGLFDLGASSFIVGGAPTTAATGTVNQSGGEVSFTSGNALLIGNTANIGNTGIYNLSGGMLTGPASGDAVRLGFNGGTALLPTISFFNLSSAGALNIGTSNLRIGRSDATSNFTQNTFNQTGGTASVGTLTIGGASGGSTDVSATLNLTSGSFTATNFTTLAAGENNTSTILIGGTAQVTLPAFPTVRGTGSTATLTFDGGTLIPAAASATYLSGLTNAFITANGAKIDVPATKDITIDQVLENAPSAVGTLTKSGLGILTLTGANTYTGNTTVVDGTLSLSSTYLADTSTLTIGTVAASPAILDLPNAGTDIVAALVIDGVAQPSGLYDSTNSGGAITGPGKIQVGAASNTYASWLTTNAPATGFTTDTDNDGVPNGVENVLGTNPNTFSAGLTQVSATANSVTYQHTLNPTIASDVSYSYQWSSDLIEWKASTMANTAGTIGTIVPSAPVSGVVTVVTTRTGTASSTLFTRIKAGNP